MTTTQTSERYLRLSLKDYFESLRFPKDIVNMFSRDTWLTSLSARTDPGPRREDVVKELDRFVQTANQILSEAEELRSLIGRDPVAVKLPRLCLCETDGLPAQMLMTKSELKAQADGLPDWLQRGLQTCITDHGAEILLKAHADLRAIEGR